MGAAVQCAAMNQQETIARLGRAQEETRKFAAEQRAFIANDARTLWPFPIGGMVAGRRGHGIRQAAGGMIRFKKCLAGQLITNKGDNGLADRRSHPLCAQQSIH